MKRFQFRLEGLLRLRRLEEERKLSSFQAVKHRLFEILTEMQDIARERRVQIQRLDGLSQGRLPVHEVRAYRYYLDVLDRRTLEVQEQWTQLRDELAEAKRALDRAMRERKVVERLRERQFESFREEQQRQETAWLDEISISRGQREEWR